MTFGNLRTLFFNFIVLHLILHWTKAFYFFIQNSSLFLSNLSRPCYFELMWTWLTKKKGKLASRSYHLWRSPPISIQSAPVCLTGCKDCTAVNRMLPSPVSLTTSVTGLVTEPGFRGCWEDEVRGASEPTAEGSFPACPLVHSARVSLSRGFSPSVRSESPAGLLKHPVLDPSLEILAQQAWVHFCQVPR